MNLVNAKHRLLFGTWNVRTLYESTKLAQAIKVMKSYRLTLMGLSEVRWNGHGEHITSSNELLLFSGKDQGQPHESGVGFLLNESAKKALLSWEPVSDRLITARFNTKFKKISFIQCYAPTEVAQVEEKQQFYEQLNRIVNNLPKGDIIIIMGDMNAKIGSDNSNLEDIMGKHGLGEMNSNGELLTNFCAHNNFVIGGSVFPHKKIHKVTWISPNLRTENQIDHVMISRRYRSSLLDVRNRRGADIASDHYLIVSQFRIKLARVSNNKFTKRPKYNVENLRLPVEHRKFKESIRQRIEESNVNSWEEAAKIFTKTADETLGVKQNKRKDWIRDHTWKLIEDRQQLKNRINATNTPETKTMLQQQYQQLNTIVKRSARHDKRHWHEQLAKEAQEAAEQRNMRQLYKITKRLSGQRMNHNTTVKSAEGRLLTTTEEQLSRWKEHFSELLGSTNADINIDVEEPRETTELPINCELPTKAEILKAIKALKNNKAAGPDNVPADILKADPNTSADILHPLITRAWENNNIPDSWKQGLIVKLPKKGDATLCQNWRGIVLLNAIHKVLSLIIHSRLAVSIEPILRRNQAGFRPNHSCVDHINTLRIIIEQSIEFRTPLHLLFIDFERAFDSIPHTILWKVLKEKGVPNKLIMMIEELYRNATCSVLHNGRTSSTFNLTTGVKQGCTLSPLLFNIMLDSVLTKATENVRGIRWTLTSHLTDLDYADDICLITQSFTDMKILLSALTSAATETGLKINTNKTKSMSINSTSNTRFTIGNIDIENVNEFTYLGSVISVDSGADADIVNKIKKAQRAFGQLKSIWDTRQLSTQTKLKLFNSNVKPVLLYGCETWRVTKTSTKRLQTFINRCLRRILKIFWPDTIRNTDLLHITNQPEVHIEIRKRKWGWIGHTLRQPNEDIARIALEWNPQGKRRPGRPAQTWRRSTIEELHNIGSSWNNAKITAKNRTRWRVFTEALCSAQEL